MTVGAFGASFDRLTLPMGLIVDHVLIQGAQAKVVSDPFKIELQEPGTIEARVSASNLAAFLNKESPGGLKEFAVAIRDGKLFVGATAKVIFDIRAEAVCTLRIEEGKKLFVDLESVEMFGVGAKSLVEQQLAKINPVLDAAEFPLTVTLSRVELVDGEVVLYGTAEP